MKNLTVLLFLTISLSAFGQGSISAETRNMSTAKVNLDLKLKASPKVYFSNWTSYQSRDIQLPRFSSYFLSETLINFKWTDKLTFSNGFQYFEDFTYDFKVLGWKAKIEYKLYK